MSALGHFVSSMLPVAFGVLFFALAYAAGHNDAMRAVNERVFGRWNDRTFAALAVTRGNDDDGAIQHDIDMWRAAWSDYQTVRNPALIRLLWPIAERHVRRRQDRAAAQRLIAESSSVSP